MTSTHPNTDSHAENRAKDRAEDLARNRAEGLAGRPVKAHAGNPVEGHADNPVEIHAGNPVETYAELQKRALRVLAAGQVVGAAALGSAITVGIYVVEDIVGVDTPWLGLAGACVTAGAAIMAQLLSRVMRRRGRRAGMQLGYGLAALGSLLAFAGVETGLLPIFLVGLVLFGAGTATNLLARYAATDLAAPGHRSTAMGRILFASTFGAIAGPLLIIPAEQAGESWFGLAKYSGPWLLSALLFTATMINVAVRLRPDPLLILQVVMGKTSATAGATSATTGATSATTGKAGAATENAGAATGTTSVDRPVSLPVALAAIRNDPTARLGLIAMVLTQLVMIGLMAMAPVVMKHQGHETLGPFVLSIHLVGMYAFSPLAGRYADRFGPRAALRAGVWVMIGSSVLSLVAGHSVLIMFLSMGALGIGSTMGLIAGSSLLSDNVPADVRVQVQGTADLLTAASGGIAGLAAGVILTTIGFGLLGVVAALLTLPILLALRQS
ncbi:MFS family permease [Actinoplanes lutulentus]|uniref:MFS transporter n=1 Tax=Actinoplanes lutulentus TaxID=1287878 RepID=A0A327Z6V0_9ACTN|nr:MFS transporter [Actinoplanes lutulentus]MBB2946911.1 MFS family permease [Actinoplanes lutulentus]RAK30414.1 MFS transporter [Actinoplanes lutulentus]